MKGKRFPWHRIDPGLPPAEYDAATIAKIKSRCRILPNGCWEYLGVRNPQGYGQTTYRGKQMGVHRATLIATGGPIPAGHDVCHRCDFPPCCNPEHVFHASRKINVADMLAKGRRAPRVTRGIGRPQPMRNGTHCARGHEYTPESTYVRPDGGRQCWICMKASMRRRHNKTGLQYPAEECYAPTSGVPHG